MTSKTRPIIALYALCLCAPIVVAQVAASQEPPDKARAWETLNYMAERREPALLVKFYIFEPPRAYTTYEIYCTGMAYSQTGVFDWATHGSRYVLLSVEQLRQVKRLMVELPAATASASDYSPADKHKRAIVVTVAGRGYSRRDYMIPPTPAVLSEVMKITEAGRAIKPFSGQATFTEPPIAEEICPEHSEADFDEERASRETLTERLRLRHLLPAQRRRALEAYVRRFYDETNDIDRYLKKALEEGSPR